MTLAGDPLSPAPDDPGVGSPRAGLDSLVFRTVAAPGLEEDDVFAALHGLPGTGVFWGDGLPPTGSPDPSWDEDRERSRRHQETLRRWPPAAP